jgi:hypothetical protein
VNISGEHSSRDLTPHHDSGSHSLSHHDSGSHDASEVVVPPRHHDSGSHDLDTNGS